MKFYTDNLKLFFWATMTDRVAHLHEYVSKCSNIHLTKKMSAMLWKLMKEFFIICTYF